MVKKTVILLVYIFCSYTLLVCGEKNILPIVRSRSRFFGPLEPEQKNTRSRRRLGKKSGAGAGAAWKKSQEPEPRKNLPAPSPQPWFYEMNVCVFIYRSVYLLCIYLYPCIYVSIYINIIDVCVFDFYVWVCIYYSSISYIHVFIYLSIYYLIYLSIYLIYLSLPPEQLGLSILLWHTPSLASTQCTLNTSQQ